ncbi:MAG: TonB-dependent receptor [Acidobacteria bacterium]|nr:TonB-dependent receptor [Acidobacteriota bacterium]
MRALPVRPSSVALCLFALAVLVLASATGAAAQSQSNAADLQGYVRDQSGAVVPGATVTARNRATSVEKSAQANDEGFYQIVNLPPGDYEVTVQAANFSRASVPAVALTVGQRADLDIPLQAGQVTETVTVSGATTEVVETSRTAVANTIDQQRIENLPINERNFTNFALTSSTVTRDNGRPIGPAPTSGLNFGGQRGRSNLVQVDGADNTDNSVNAARTTVSQEAVQEFQVVTNSYAPEFGRTSGGVVNVVTKSGGNDLHGNLFGFIRHKSIQARNAFAPIIDNDPDKKPPFTRAQYGATVGGPLDRDRTFFFLALEQRKRQESGFFTSPVAQGLNGSFSIGPGTPFPVVPAATTFTRLTPAQVTFLNTAFANALTISDAAARTARITGLVTYATLASNGGNNGLSAVAGVSRFAISNQLVPVSAGAFRPLLSLPRIFPISDDTTFSSGRLDHKITDANLLTMRLGYNESDLTGIQVESQNQSLGQNDFSRTGQQTLRDTSFVTTLNSTLSDTVVNEARFNFGQRRATFRSQLNDSVAVNIADTAFFGRELFSPVIRTEKRFQYTDNVNWVMGDHSFKFGADANFISVDALFELNFSGLFNFGPTNISPFITSPTGAQLVADAPVITAVQAYGAGIPSTFIQGFGNPVSRLKNRPYAVFAQDSWKARRNLTINYGVRYDYEATDQIAPVGFTDPLTGIALSAADILRAQDVLGVQQGIPRDKNNIAPRAGLAWDITNDAKTVLRASFGIFYDHPLLAIAFNSDIADASQQQQYVNVLPGSPAPTASLNLLQLFQGTVIPGVTPGVARSAVYQTGRQRFDDQTFPGFGPVLPFTLPISKDFEYAYANQGNVTLERQLTNDIAVSASYLFVGAHHLPHPLDVNAPRTDLLIENFRRFAGPGFPQSLISTSAAQAGITIATTAPGSTFTNQFGVTCGVVIPGIIAQCPTGRVIVPAIANFFRPNAPNYFLATAASGGLVSKAVLDSQLAGTLRTPGPISPFGSVNAQVSDGNSVYHAGNFELRKRFSQNYQFLASYTWSHAIDDSSDLQTLLLPQDNRNFRAERADSLFDQRHRFVFSGILAAPDSFRSAENGFKRFLADFTVAPIVELSSGRPFNIITNTDANADQSSQTDRPSVLADGTLCVPGTAGCVPNITNGQFTTGSLGRNAGITHGYASLDMRLTRKVRFGERIHLDVIAEGFNLFNRFNEGSASPFFGAVNTFNQRDSSGRYYSRPTAAFDPRQFQFGLKLNF